MILGIDVSQWNPTMDWKLLKENGVEFAIIKATQGNYSVDPLLKTHVEGAKKAGMIVGLYHWCDPLVKYAAQADFFLRTVQGLEFDLVAADVEQFWADWGEWSRKAITKYLAPEVISENGRNTLAYWADRIRQPGVLYTRTSFVQAYARPMLNWMGRVALWMAHYPYNSTRLSTSWAQFKTVHKPAISGPTMPAGFAANSWRFWQFTGDKFVLPGCSGAIDVNAFNGDLDGLLRFVGRGGSPSVPENPPAKTIEERVGLLEQEARGHGWNI